MTVTASLSSARSLLFVPGSRPDRFDKAAASGADLVVVDLEDAVSTEHKEQARADAAAWLADRVGGSAQPPSAAAGAVVGVRINPPGSDEFAADLDAVAEHPCVVMVPKSQSPEYLEDVCAALHPDAAVLGLLETAAGVLHAQALAAVEGVARLAFGNFDLAAELGVSPDDRDAMAWSRGALVLASAAAGIAPPFDGVTGDVSDADLLRRDFGLSVRQGFAGKLCIHPRQVAVVHEVLQPSAEDLAWAESVVAAAGSGGVAVVAGQMVDKPVVDRAHRLLARQSAGAANASR